MEALGADRMNLPAVDRGMRVDRRPIDSFYASHGWDEEMLRSKWQQRLDGVQPSIDKNNFVELVSKYTKADEKIYVKVCHQTE